MRWSQGQWSEDRLIHAVNQTESYVAIPYGPSGVAPNNDVRAFELYFERLEAAGLGEMKRPDLLIFRAQDKLFVEQTIEALGGSQELPFTHENNSDIAAILARAVIAVECENSLWKARQMPDYQTPLTPQKRLGGLLGLKKSAVTPTVIIKDEDVASLRRWQMERGVAIHIWHAFYDEAYGVSLDEALRLIGEGLIIPTEQIFQAPSGSTTRKAIFKIYHQYAYLLGQAEEEATLEPAYIVDKNGHILPYVTFKGGRLILSSSALETLNAAADQRFT